MKRFYDKAMRQGECLIWNAYKMPSGYGLFRLNGKTTLAHRAAWIIRYGEIKDSLMVLHRCDNPSCVELDHLFLGTGKDNMQDKIAKGRYNNGQSLKTSCPNGHKYDETNTRVYKNKRFCRRCDNQRKK